MMITQHGKRGYQLYEGGETNPIVWDQLKGLLCLGLLRYVIFLLDPDFPLDELSTSIYPDQVGAR